MDTLDLANVKKPTAEQADALIALPKVVSTDVSWYRVPTGWRLKMKAVSDEPRLSFEVTAYKGKRNHSFVLLFNKYPIRKYTKHAPHEINGVVYTEPHKHRWDEILEDKVGAYIPSDIDPKSDINEQFLAFCKECNIELVGAYQPIMIP